MSDRRASIGFPAEKGVSALANKVTIYENVCKGCGLCTLVCPKKIVALDRSKINEKGYNPSSVTDMSQCIACAMCATMCPDSAIKVERE